LFAKADEEHEHVVAAYKSSQAAHEKYVEIVKEVATLIAEANGKHKQFVETRQKADEWHQKAMELRDKIFEKKGEERAERHEARQIIKEQAKRAREAISNPEKRKEFEERSIDQLKKGGKIRIG
jgi:uncharacterized coiled-coil DUF342 family protein